jgi:hypothetical protein
LDFRLTRIILIDSYCRSRIVELDVSGHITINGENGAGKTTLLRLLPMFFGESPSRIIRGDAVTERFGSYYFPTTGSYVIFEYLRRTHKAMAVIHPDGQSGEGVVYRLIDSEYKPELFKHEGQVVQTRDLYRHLDKTGVFESKPLTLQAYRQIIQNTAGREHRSLAARFSFTGGTGKLTHLERVVTGILQRATTFHDLKKMIVSSVLNGDEVFALRTGRRDLQHWLNEHEAHRLIMEKAPVMAELEQSDQGRRMINQEFTFLHAKFQLLHDHFQNLVGEGEKAEARAKEDLVETEEAYRKRLQIISDAKVEAEARAKQARLAIEQLDARKRKYDADDIAGKIAKVDSLAAWEAELKPLKQQLDDLEKEVKSLTETFTAMETEAKNQARDQKSELDDKKPGIYESFGKRKEALIETHGANLKALRLRHEPELDAANTKVTDLKTEKAGLEVEVKNTQADPEIIQALEMEREKQTNANTDLTELHDKTDALQKAHIKAKREVDDLELQANEGEMAIEKAEVELEELLAADAAGEDTFLGFLRRNKPNWAADIGRVVSPETLLRTDLSPVLGEGSDLYGVTVDLEQLKASRYSSEEAIQQEIKLVRGRLEKRKGEVAEDKKSLAKKKDAMDKAKAAITLHEAAIATAKNRKLSADTAVKTALVRVEQSKREAAKKSQEALDACVKNLSLAVQGLETLKKDHRKEIDEAERLHAANINQLKSDETTALNEIDARKKAIDAALATKISQIAKDRDASLRDKGYSTDVLNGLRTSISKLEGQIAEANRLRSEVTQYHDWFATLWSQRPEHEQTRQKEEAEIARLKRENQDLLLERKEVTEKKQAAIKEIGEKIDKHERKRVLALGQTRDLVHWPQDQETLKAGFEQVPDIDALVAERRRLMGDLDALREKIRQGVEEIRRQIISIVGTGPEKFYASAVAASGYPRPGMEHEWIEVFRTWFLHEHETNRTDLLQRGKTLAQNISYFWKSLDDFKRNVSTFAADLRANLEQGQIFDSIADVSTEIRAEVDTQGYWEAVGNLHREYETWHANGDPALPPASFVDAAKQVALVVGEDKGLVADPVDLISLKISANVNNQGVKTASNEHELANISSNGLSYIILCVILIGFVNRIRRSENVVVPFVVDELKDLSFANAKTLLDLLTRNNITMISAFPDVDLDLAELFERNYKILPGRKVGLINLEDEVENDEEEAHV